MLKDVGRIGDFVAWLLWILAVTGTVYSYMFHERYLQQAFTTALAEPMCLVDFLPCLYLAVLLVSHL